MIMSILIFVCALLFSQVNGKSSGKDEVPAELLKIAGETTMDKMYRIYTVLWETGEWPDDWMNIQYSFRYQRKEN